MLIFQSAKLGFHMLVLSEQVMPFLQQVALVDWLFIVIILRLRRLCMYGGGFGYISRYCETYHIKPATTAKDAAELVPPSLSVHATAIVQLWTGTQNR